MRDDAEGKKVLVIQTHGIDTPRRTYSPLFYAMAAASMDMDVTVWFTMEGTSQLKRGAVVGAVLVGAVLVLAMGIFGAVRGEREIEHHGDEDHADALVVGDDYATASGLGETDAHA